MFAIRHATVEDAAQIIHIMQAAWGQVQVPDASLVESGLIALEHRAFVAVVDKRVVGFASSFPTTTERWELDLLAVDPAYHGRGIGKRLITASDEAGVRSGRAFSRALVQVNNTPMMKALTSQGYSSDNRPHMLYVCDGGTACVSEETTIPVTTLTYHGAWIESAVTEAEKPALTPGTVVGMVVQSTDRTTREKLESLAFVAVDAYYWWQKTLRTSAP